MGPQAAESGNATSTMDLRVENFLLPISTIVASSLITARAAVLHLLRQGTGVVVLLSGTPSKEQPTPPPSAPPSAHSSPSQDPWRSTSARMGVRVVCVRTMGMTETRIMHQTYELGGQAMGAPKEKIEEIVASRALLGRPPSLVDTAGLITFLASDQADTITGAIINSSGGQVLD